MHAPLLRTCQGRLKLDPSFGHLRRVEESEAQVVVDVRRRLQLHGRTEGDHCLLVTLFLDVQRAEIVVGPVMGRPELNRLPE